MQRIKVDMKSIVFYSWQSDLPNPVNRGFIQSALESVAKTIAQDEAVKIEPVIDRDTQGLPGAPDIGQAIFRKIEAADVFVCDVSIINAGAQMPDGTPPCRLTPNPNVLIELGYAAHHLSWDRIVLVINEHYGKIQDLPFDLHLKRALSYRLAPEADKTAAKQELTSKLDSAVRAILNAVENDKAAMASIADAAPSDQAITAINDARPNSQALTRAFTDDLVNRLVSIAPRFTDDDGEVMLSELKSALAQSAPLVADYARVAHAAASTDSLPVARELFRALEPIANHYYASMGFSDSFTDAGFDFYKFLGHELMVTLAGQLLDFERWTILGDILRETLHIHRTGDLRGKSEAYYVLCRRPVLFTWEWERQQKSGVFPHSALLKERHEVPPLSVEMPWPLLIEADYFLFLYAQLQESSGTLHWYAWSSLFLGTQPRFAVRLQSRAVTETVAGVMGLTVDELKQRLDDPQIILNPRRVWGQGWILPFPQLKSSDIAVR